MSDRYFRPVGCFRYRYCYRVDRVCESDGFLAFDAVRFGLDDALQPVKDGHQNRSFPGHMTCLRSDLYRVHDISGWGSPLYFREITVRHQQGELFA